MKGIKLLKTQFTDAEFKKLSNIKEELSIIHDYPYTWREFILNLAAIKFKKEKNEEKVHEVQLVNFGEMIDLRINETTCFRIQDNKILIWHDDLKSFFDEIEIYNQNG